MEKVDLKYVKKLFEWLERSEEICAFYYEKEDIMFELKEKLGRLLDIICEYADELDISEVHKTDGYSDNRFCYWIRYKGKVVELGMYYDDVVYASIYPDKVYEDSIIDCEEAIKFHNNKNKAISKGKQKTYKKTTKVKTTKD